MRRHIHLLRGHLLRQPVGVAALLAAALALVPAAAWAAATTVKGVRIGEHKDKTRLVLDLSGPTDARPTLSPDGRTLAVDLPGAAWSGATTRAIGSSPHISGYEAVSLPEGGVRLTISGKQPLALRDLQRVSPGEGYGHRLVLDVAAGAAPALAAPVAPMMVMAPAGEVAAPSPAAAPGPYFAPHVGTLGFGVDAGYRVNESLGLRATGNYFALNRSGDIDGVSYKADGTMKNFGVLADYHPFGGGFHLTGGAYVNMNEASMSGTPTTSVMIGNNSYSPTDIGTLNGKVDFNRFTPYLGLGWKGSLLHPNLTVGADLGVIYQGSPRVSLSSTGALNSADYQADLERERKNIEDELAALRFYPVATVSVGYKF